MITITFNFTTTAAAAALFAKLNGTELGAIADEPAPAVVKEVAAAAVEKPKASAAKTAPSPRTAEVAAAAAPAASTEATGPAADASSASPSVAYPDLQKAVLALHKLDPSAALPIAKGLGADTFKTLPEAKWAEALRLVTAKTSELQAA